MITGFLLTILQTIVSAVLTPFQALPDVALDPNLINGIANVQGIMSTIEPIFPLETLLSILGIVVGIEIAIFTYKAIMWLIKKIPTIS